MPLCHLEGEIPDTYGMLAIAASTSAINWCHAPALKCTAMRPEGPATIASHALCHPATWDAIKIHGMGWATTPGGVGTIHNWPSQLTV